MSHFFADLRKLHAFLGVFFSFTMIAACVSTDVSKASKTPESIVKSYIQAVANDHLDKAAEYLVDEMQTSLEEEEVKIPEEFLELIPKLKSAKKRADVFVIILSFAMQMNDGLDSVSTIFADGNSGDISNVVAEVKYKNGVEEAIPMILIKKSGKWKIKVQ